MTSSATKFSLELPLWSFSGLTSPFTAFFLLILLELGKLLEEEEQQQQKMKKFIFSFEAYTALLLAAILLTLPTISRSIRLTMPETPVSFKSQDSTNGTPKDGLKEELGMEMFPTGSSLPDCSHACGPCSPCKRVMVSFKCSTAESCPIVYRCMCKGRYYHVPSN